MNFLNEVREKKCFVPKIEDIKFKPCSYPPTNSILKDKVCKLIEMGDYGGNEVAK